MAARREFVQAVRTARRRQLQWTAESIQRVDRIYRAAAKDVAGILIERAKEGSLRQAQLRALLDDIAVRLDALKADYGDLLDVHLLGSAQINADREARIVQLALPADEAEEAAADLVPSLTREVRVNHVGRIEVSFGRVSKRAVEATFARIHRDGLTLSDRLWRLDRGMREAIEDIVTAGIARGESARDLAKQLRGFLSERGTGNARYNAMRLSRTEIMTAHREAHIAATTDDSGRMKPWVQGIKWHLSASHPQPDICDDWASQDVDGLGAGIYLPQNVPVDHPQGICFTTTVIEGFEAEQVTRPNPDAVPESQRHYYGVSQ